MFQMFSPNLLFVFIYNGLCHVEGFFVVLFFMSWDLSLFCLTTFEFGVTESPLPPQVFNFPVISSSSFKI